ncbi:MAG: rhodanese-like domain-containing protein [Nostocaceae cyanobacterium CSU_2_110]|nr:rhodanese-like domain-containing protein [Richelia sp. SM2_1_7]NJM23931.1 rhodanese-like domain-containing protein [Richelia sp. SM1_7_0]NJN08490.1 rhodanese-like domain-containing protein [Richelia sp. RM1_1_1]NJO29316.1 rhodanese-like domain-containing protein [Richelia sp. SL_2_1]NJS17103.1 rhodanese-like domain-containing protein [Nostocaceae cyanobacterium CSU_2_110]
MANNPLENIIPSQPPVDQRKSDVYTLKSRLEWGEPAFTILDVRDRQTYNEGHIMGALPMTMDGLGDTAAQSLAKSRDIYVYGASDTDSAQAAQALRSKGFENVSELKGGLSAWKAIGGPTEGIVESMTPAGKDDYNVVDRMKDQAANMNK